MTMRYTALALVLFCVAPCANAGVTSFLAREAAYQGISHYARGYEHGNYHHGADNDVSPTAGVGVPRAAQIAVDSPVIVAFSPDGDCTQVIVNAINAARTQILVQAYSFTSKPILAALAQARARGVGVTIILDKSNERSRYSGATYEANHGIPVYIDDTVRIAHNKVMIFDQQAVLTGSFNFSAAAQKDNAENILLLEDVPQLAAAYTRDFMWRLRKSHLYTRSAR